MKIAALAGGVGGAKLADGLAQILSPEDLTIIVNTGDDFEHLGLFISPDLDTICYTLAGLANPETGWGRREETFNLLENLQKLGGPDWFRLGDQDMATHLERTRRLREGQTLSQITSEFCRIWGVKHTVLPMSDQPVNTMVETTEDGELAFQEYFVQRKCQPTVKGFRFAGIESALPAPGVLNAIKLADAIVICPSNPWVSIDTILALPAIRPLLSTKQVVAVSPIIGGRTVKGPAAKMYTELGLPPSALTVARHYSDILSGFILDSIDSDLAKFFTISTVFSNTIMKTQNDRRSLAQDVLNLIRTL
ncbi:MAG: 2-phospho-L-lactate transferase [Anaerolineales bacterium]|jgi:LPPG:FO 2-phospho-L-lactate transferase